jgi:signal transduction histidine kinase
VALSYEIRLALTTAEAGGEVRTKELLEQAMAEALAALDDLRELAHGIYPAVLATSGLGPALIDLADTAAVYVEVRADSAPRCPQPVEMAAYILVREAVDDAARRGASEVVVEAVREGGWLVVTVVDDGAGRSSHPVRLADRVSALGGTLAIEASSLRGEIPCA